MRAFSRHPIISLNPRIRYLTLVSLIVLFATTKLFWITKVTKIITVLWIILALNSVMNTPFLSLFKQCYVEKRELKWVHGLRKKKRKKKTEFKKVKKGKKWNMKTPHTKDFKSGEIKITILSVHEDTGETWRNLSSLSFFSLFHLRLFSLRNTSKNINKNWIGRRNTREGRRKGEEGT